MRYLVRQKIFSLGDQFTIKNQQDEDCFQVAGKVFSIGKKLTLMDMNENELFFVEQKVMSFMPEFHLKRQGEVVAIVRKKLSFLKAKFEISSNLGNFEIDGSVMGYNFTITKNGQVVGTVSKDFFALSDSYGVEVAEGQDHSFIVALVIVIDQVMHSDKN